MSRLSQYFSGIAAKRLTKVETNPKISHQHELNGIVAMKELFGSEKAKYDCDFVYLGLEEDETIVSTGNLTWYDARKDHPKRTEYRMYYPSNDVTKQAKAEDLLIIGKRGNNNVLFLVISEGSTYEKQALWLFGIEENIQRFKVKKISGSDDSELGHTERTILETLGIEVDIADNSFLDLILSEFGDNFPSTKEFSDFARHTIDGISSVDDPDLALIKWIEREEVLFKTLEEYIVEGRIQNGFASVEDFISFSLSVQNRRKSRAGYALENHLEKIFEDFNIKYSNNKITENKSRPDFIFPGIDQYHSPKFPTEGLTMLGAKSTCKDRWRQVLSEARKITKKHLLTLEPSISEFQTDEMKSNNLQLVLPAEIHNSYTTPQKEWLMNLSEFIAFVKAKQTS